MDKVLVGRKEGMTRIYNEEREVVPVTIVESPDCVLLNKREVDGRPSVQLGFEKTDKLNKPEAGQFESRGIEPRRVLREFIVAPDSPLLELENGEPVETSLFTHGDRVDVKGVTKGRGFQGSMKRWGFSGGPGSHGGGLGRKTGSIGQAADPSRVFPGKKMPGRYGNDQKTMQNLTVQKVIEAENLLLISGSVPGAEGEIVIVHSALKGDNNGN